MNEDLYILDKLSKYGFSLDNKRYLELIDYEKMYNFSTSLRSTRVILYNRKLIDTEGAVSFTIYDASFGVYINNSYLYMNVNDVELSALIMKIARYINYYSLMKYSLKYLDSFDIMLDRFLDVYLYFVTIHINRKVLEFKKLNNYSDFISVYDINNCNTVIDFWNDYYNDMYKDLVDNKGLEFMTSFMHINFKYFPDILLPPDKLMNFRNLIL